MKRLFTLSLLLLVAFIGFSQSSFDEIREHIWYAHPSYSPYPEDAIKTINEAPKGYTPVYISHYARHGSRYFTDEPSFVRSLKALRSADSLHLLTPFGQEVFAALRAMDDIQRGQYGMLTSLGAEQHKGIAGRMFEKFSSVFKHGAKIIGKASSSKRSTESMYAFVEGLKANAPEMDYELTNSKKVQLIVKPQSSKNPEYTKALQKEYSRAGSSKDTSSWRAEERAWKKTLDFSSMEEKVFTDADKFFRETKINRFSFAYDLLGRVSFGNNFETDFRPLVRELFTDEQLYNLYLYDVYHWYYRRSCMDLKAVRNYVGLSHILVEDFINCTDEALKGNGVAADIRFGHDTFLVPLISCMGFENMQGEKGDIREIAEWYRPQHITPMGGNVQMIVYKGRNAKDILVRFLVNENDATLPIKSKIPGFYKWQDVKTFWTKRIEWLRN